MESLGRILNTLRIIWFAFIVTPFVFGAVLFVLAPDGEGADPMLPLILAFVALTEVPALIFMRFKLLGGLAVIEPNDMRVDERVEGEALEEAIRVAAAKYNTGSIVSFAFCNAIVLMGFVGSYVSGSLLWFGGLAVLGLTALIAVVPRRAGVMSTMTPEQRQGLRQLIKDNG